MNAKTNSLTHSCALLSIYHEDRLDWLKKAILSIDMDIIKKTYIGVDGPVNPEVNLYLKNLNKDSFRVIKFKENRGLAFVLNDLIEIALRSCREYDFFFRIDADDINFKKRFSLQRDYLESNPDVDVLGGGAILIDEEENELGRIYKPNEHKNIIKSFPFESPFVHPTVVFRRTIISKTKYPTYTVRFEDIALWSELILQNKKFANLENTVIKYRVTKELISRRSGFRKNFIELKVRLGFLIRFNRFFSKNTALTLGLFFIKVFIPKKLLKYFFNLKIKII